MRRCARARAIRVLPGLKSPPARAGSRLDVHRATTLLFRGSRALLAKMPSRLETAVVGESLVRLAFPIAERAGHDDLRHGKQVARRATRIRTSPTRQAQLASRRGARGHFQTHRSRQGWNLE